MKLYIAPKSEKAQMQLEVDEWLTPVEITEEEMEKKFHAEYSTPQDENYAIEYDAYMAAVKAILSKLKGE